MRVEYDFSKAVKNPHTAQLAKQISIRLDEESLSDFKSISAEAGQAQTRDIFMPRRIQGSPRQSDIR